MNTKTVATIAKYLLAIVLIAFIAVFYWPGVYVYKELKAYNGTYPVRINRFTNKTEIFNPDVGWSDQPL